MNTSSRDREIEQVLGIELLRRPNHVHRLFAKDDYVRQQLASKPAVIGRARRLIQAALHHDQGSEILWSALGYCHELQCHPRLAVKCFLRSVELSPSNMDNWYDLGRAYGQLGDRKAHQALNDYTLEIARAFCCDPTPLTPDTLKRLIMRVEQLPPQLPWLHRPTILNLNKDLISVTSPDGAKKKRILFVNPPVVEPMSWRAGAPRTVLGRTVIGKLHSYNLPIGLLRIAAKLLEEGNEIVFIDGMASLPRAFPNSKQRMAWEGGKVLRTKNHYLAPLHRGASFDRLERMLHKVGDVDEVYVGCTFTFHNESAHSVVRMCKKAFPRARVKFGGIYPTLAPEEARKSGADEIVAGPIAGTEDLPLNYNILGYHPGYTLIKGTRGCPNRCSYCAVHRLEGNTFSHRDPEEVFAEILDGYNTYRARDIAIWDSNLLVDYDDYFGIILKKIADTKLPLYLRAPEGIDYRLLTPEIAEDMRRAGFGTVNIALENMDADFSSACLNRSNDINAFRRAVSILNDAGFSSGNLSVFLMVGLPGQSIQNVIDNIRYVWSLGCNITVYPFTPIPGTALYEKHLSQIKSRSLAGLHQFYFPFVECPDDVDVLLELLPLNLCCNSCEPQEQMFKEVVRPPSLRQSLERDVA
jgi:hypothetical protein